MNKLFEQARTFSRNAVGGSLHHTELWSPKSPTEGPSALQIWILTNPNLSWSSPFPWSHTAPFPDSMRFQTVNGQR